MLRVYSCIAQEHDLRLLLVAVAICFFTELTSFTLAGDIRRMATLPQRRWSVMIGFVVASGIWATHFIAMLAYQPHLPSAYSPLLTTLSFLVCFAVCFAAMNIRSIVWGSLQMTVGISTMHFIGMAALETTGRLEYDFSTILAASTVGALFVAASSWTFGRFKTRLTVIPALLFTLAVAAIHFGSMSAITIVPDPGVVISPSSISPQSLTIVVSAFVVALLTVSLVMLKTERRIITSGQEEAQRMKLFADTAMEGLAVLEDDRIIDANAVFWKLAGYAEGEAPEQIELGDLIPDLAGAEREAPFIETLLVRPDAEPLDIEAALRRTSMLGKPCTLLVVRDISDRKAAAARIAHLATHDPLTGVGNRLAFNRALEQRLADADAAQPLGLLCIDLDRFKPVNDLYGHPIGDTLLIKVTRRISALLDKSELLARLGGDEFAVLTNRTPARASQLAEDIIEELSASFTIEEQTITIGASIGIAYAPTNAHDAQTLHSRADLALYRAKGDGRSCFRFFDCGMDDQVVEAFRMKAELRTALQEGQLQLHYQPLANLTTDEIIGFEALLRWTHPELGQISPTTFIPLAEETGLIVPIGEWVMREACREAARWPNGLKIAVNLSPVQFTTGNIVEIVASALAWSGLEAHRLDIEITEGVLVKDADGALKILNALKALGVQISMDDFGTGYSSLSYFRQFPFDKVKIDQTFIRDMETNPQSRAIIRAIIGLAKGLDVEILAEGVETEVQIDMLKRKGCELIQGYAISRPAPIEQFDEIVGGRVDIDQRAA
ncbi:EAL domain-containing protein [Novosphingobium sp. JCM 18896]|uniref:bifunctional diguanylate cyclase/phosphodiesterase n=1 Tax=Novosphingobium sp. JCM 18896 TaxID=2989731 RepID=UPI00222398E6|nr:EAL domain-containing protein [Novosphingobium sp. JCM 18896]MCW1431342.1 EAL domain-containing protein [Novosphingobium sp. JCM 18896]